VYTKNALGDNGCNWQIVEGFGDCFEYFDAEFAFALIIEAIDFIQFAWFVVAPQQEKGQRVLYFIGHQKADWLQWFFPTIDVISQKQVVVVGGVTQSFKNVQ